MKEKLSVLHMDDDENDSLLIERELRKAYDADLVRVQTPEETRTALDEHDFDLVLSEYQISHGFRGPGAMAMFKGMDFAIPFVVVTGNAGDRIAVEMLTQGADNYVMKDNLERLIPAVKQSLAKAEEARSRKRAEKRATESEERYRTLVEENPYGVQEIDKDGIILFANAAHYRMLGYEKDELIGRSIADLLEPGPQRDELPRYLKMLVKDQPAPTLYFQKNLQKGGEVRDTEVSWNYLRDEEGRVRGFISVLTDVTERKRAEEQRLRLARQMQQAQKLESLGVLAGGIAHDFNNLLTAILGNANMALQELPGGSETRVCVEAIQKASRRAADLTQQMLAYAGDRRFSIEPVNLNEIVGEMANLLRASISKKVALNTDLRPGLPAIKANAAQMQQVAMNLITNASEACGEDQGTVTVSTGAMECDGAYLQDSEMVAIWGADEGLAEGPYVYLEVEDTGCGMDEQTRARVFEPFFTTKFTGRGLGLASALGIMRSHRGAISVRSEPGKGSTFRALIPALPAQAEYPTSGNATREAENRTGAAQS